jgi:tetratricopeptide (TPR) repeat protein
MVEGMLMLRRGDVAGAQAQLSDAAQQAPEDPQLRYALGFAYMAGGNHAFAEQAFRGVVEKQPKASGLRVLIAELLRRQGRIEEAVQELVPMLADPAQATPAIQRFVGELHLAVGRFDQALPLLQSAFEAAPTDRRVLNALVATWRRSADPAAARDALDAALQRQPRNSDGWRARFAFEAAGSEAALAVATRWVEAMPDHVPALEARMAALGVLDRDDEADGVAGRILELQPGHGQAELRRIDTLLRADPDAALARIDELLPRVDGDQGRQILRGWRGLALDRAGRYAEAAAAWVELQAAAAEQRLPLPGLTAGDGPWPAPGEAASGAPSVAFLVGLPGSRVEQLAIPLSGTVAAFRADRLSAKPPADGLQNYTTPRQLLEGAVEPAAVVEGWRAALPQRDVHDGEVVDWLLWWDNALLHALRPHLPQATVLVAIRDPRDMLLDWLAFGSPAPLRIENPKRAASWLAHSLGHLARLHEQDLQPHALLRLDDIDTDPAALAKALGEALQLPLPEPPARALGKGHFPSGHWRHYAKALAEPFALLTPVAVRLGYPEA